MRERLNICFVLGSSRLWPSYLGVMEVLEREEIPFHSLVGGGSGGLVASLYSLRPEAEWLTDHLQSQVSQGLLELFDYERFPLTTYAQWAQATSQSPYSQEDLERIFPPFVEKKHFEDALIPLALVAQDLRRGIALLRFQGDLFPFLLGTLSFPGYFPPYQLEGNALVDPYFHSPLPLRQTREWGVDVVVGVRVSWRLPQFAEQEKLSGLETVSRLHYLQRRNSLLTVDSQADYLIEIESEFPEGTTENDFAREVDLGRRAAEASLDDIHRLLERKRHTSWRKLSESEDEKPIFSL